MFEITEEDAYSPDVDWQKESFSRYEELEPTLRSHAVQLLREELKGTLPEIRERIEENPSDWLMGRKEATCSLCHGEKTYARLKPEIHRRIEEERIARSLAHGVFVNTFTREDFETIEEARTKPENRLPPEPCPHCEGRGTAPEYPLHHGWGTAVRNLLREHGFGEKEFGVDNLDDYYVPLVEVAALETPSWLPTEGRPA